MPSFYCISRFMWIFKFVFLKRLVTFLTYGPLYLKLTHVLLVSVFYSFI